MATGAPPASRFAFVHKLHPHIANHAHEAPVKVEDQHGPGFNGRVAIILTNGVGTMWCAYAFGVLALIALPQALRGGLLPIIQWISQTFIQLVMLSVIMVGQNILGQASDKRAEDTYKDAEATFHEANQIQEHLSIQDQHLAAQDARLEQIIRALTLQFPNLASGLENQPS